MQEKYEEFKYKVRKYARVGEKETGNHDRDHPVAVEVYISAFVVISMH